MQLSSKDLILLSNIAICAASRAGQLITKYSRQQLVVKNKIAGDSFASQVVTEVDHLSQEIILKTLTPCCKTFDLALLTEESDDDQKRFVKDYFWCIDPLDGTLPFIESVSGYAVSIALVSRLGSPMIGVIYDPLEQTLYHAIKGGGAFRNNKLWDLAVTPPAEKNYLTLVCDRSFTLQKNYLKLLNELENISREFGFKGLKTIQHGGAAMNACWVLENNPGCYFKFPKPQDGGGSLWDYAATACLFNEIGGAATDIYGKPLDLNRADSTFMNNRGIIYSYDQKLAERISNIYTCDHSSILK